MPTEEYSAILDREQAIESARPLIELVCPILVELVNHASWAFRRITAASDNLGGENEDLAALILYRHMIELVDGVEVLFRSSCTDAAVPLIRGAFEASLSLDYIFQADYQRRSLSWLCSHLHVRMARHRLLDPSSATGKEFDALSTREFGRPLGGERKGKESQARIAALLRVLDTPTLRPIELEYQRLKKERKGRAPEWFSLFDGPKNRKELARVVDRESEYSTVYGPWSHFSHAGDAAAYLRPGERPGEAAFLAVRSPQQMQFLSLIAARLILLATRSVIDHFRKGEDLSAWYAREVRDRMRELHQLKVNVTETGDW